MSPPDSESSSPRGVLVKKPKTSVYSVLMVIATVAMLIACLLLWLELGRYGGFFSEPWSARI